MTIEGRIIELGENINIDLRPITQIMNKIGAELIDASIIGTSPALCLPGRIYLDLNKLETISNDELVPFILLHEIAHYKRFTNPYLDLDNKTKNIGLMTVDEYCELVIKEEILADIFRVKINSRNCLIAFRFSRFLNNFKRFIILFF